MSARRTVAAAVRALLIVSSVGCYLPVRFTEPASPSVIGWYRRSDGTPAPGARVVVTDQRDDCTRPLGVGASDSAGIFRLAPTTVERRGLLLVPPMEHFANTYWMCISAADSLLHMAYSGTVMLTPRPVTPAVDSLACLEWSWQNLPRVTCAGPAEKRSLQSTGNWTAGTATGYHRLIVVEPASDARDPGVFVQWVERPPSGSPETVRETVSLFSREIWKLEAVELYPDGAGRPACVLAQGVLVETSFWTWKTARERHAYLLGAPGQMTPVEHCSDTSRMAGR